MRQRESDHKVGHGQQQGLLLLQPLLPGVVLALGTVAVFAGVVAVTGLIALITGVHVPTQGLGAALFDSRHRLQMTSGNTSFELFSIGRGGGKSRPAQSRQVGHQLIDDHHRIGGPLLGQVGVQRRARKRVVPQVALDLAQVDPGLQQMRGVTVAQRMDRSRFVKPACLQSRPEGPLHPTFVHRLIHGQVPSGK